MKVLILCGGVGTRLKEETEFKPKPMVYVGNKPIIWHIMKHFAHFGHNEFVLALGYKADYIKDFFLNQKAFTTDFTLETSTHKTKFYLKNRSEDAIDNFSITFVDTGLESLIGERILRCKEYLKKEETFIVTYGDGVGNINIKRLLNFHKKQNTIATITGVHPRTKFGLLKVSNNNLISMIEEKPVLSEWVNGGYMVFNKEIFPYLHKDEMDIAALKKLIKKKQLSLFKHSGFWFAVDTFKELEDLNKIWDSGNPPWKIWK
jgi:glucose-1-phosphate cytidylyltransferase